MRLDRNRHDETQSEKHVGPMDITGKVMKGWARVRAEGIESDEQLERWIDRAVQYVQTLPVK